MAKVSRIILKSFNPRVHPLSYKSVLTSLLIGIYLMIAHRGVGLTEGGFAILGLGLWGWGLLVGSVALIAAMICHWKRIAQAGAMLNFVLWFFACITLFQQHNWLILIAIAFVQLIGFAYLYIAASFDILWAGGPQR